MAGGGYTRMEIMEHMEERMNWRSKMKMGWKTKRIWKREILLKKMRTT